MTKTAKLGLVTTGCAAALIIAAAPSFIRARRIAQMNSCLNHQAQIDGAKQQWAIENHKATNGIPTWADLLRDHKYLRAPLGCPAGGVYTIGRVDESPRCSIPTHRRAEP